MFAPLELSVRMTSNFSSNDNPETGEHKSEEPPPLNLNKIKQKNLAYN
jgi:hypothetical protein